MTTDRQHKLIEGLIAAATQAIAEKSDEIAAEFEQSETQHAEDGTGNFKFSFPISMKVEKHRNGDFDIKTTPTLNRKKKWTATVIVKAQPDFLDQ